MENVWRLGLVSPNYLTMRLPILLTLTLGLLSSTAHAQQEYSVFTATGRAGVATTLATDYQAIGINPANLGLPPKYEDKRVTFGVLEVGVSAYTKTLQKQEFRDAILSYGDETFTYDQKVEAAREFSTTPFLANVDIGILGGSYQFEDGGGGIGFAVRERAQFYSVLSDQAANLLFQGYNYLYFDKLELQDGSVIDNAANLTPEQRALIVRGFTVGPGKAISELFNGSRINFNWTREYNLSYGRQVFGGEGAKLYGGIGVKYVQSFAVLNIEVADNQLVEAYAASSPGLGIDYGQAMEDNPSRSDASGMKPVGTGFGLDFGLNATFMENDRLKIGFSVTNIGSINYDVNLYTVTDDLIDSTDLAGFNSYNIPYEIAQLEGDDGVIEYKGLAEKKQRMPTVVRLGGSYAFSEKVEVGADVVIPTNEEPGSFNDPIYSVGADYYVIPAIRLSSGFSVGGNYEKVNVPIGVTFIAGKGTYEVGIASRDAVSFFVENGPSLSVALGFFRFRF